MARHHVSVNPGDEIGGYRLVRQLGSGTRSRVFLGHDGAAAVAVKAFRPGATPESIDNEIAGLSSASHAHVVRLREVGTGRAGLPYLVLERLEATSLAAILRSREQVAAGEAVTILAPIVAALGALHASGVAHGSLSPGRVLFRGTGAPVLVGLGHATLFVPPTSAAVLSSSRPVLEDRLAMSRLVRAVLSHLDEPAPALANWLAALERDGYPEGFTDSLSERLFALGHPTPVRFAVPASRTPSIPPAASATVLVSKPDASWRERLAAFAQPPLVARLVSGARSVRRPIWLAAALGLGSLVAALVLVPSPSGGEAATPKPAQSSAAAPPSTAASGVLGDDPLAAVPVLFIERARCVRDLSVLCLENVVQSGSAAMDDDAALIRSIESGQTTGVIAELVSGSQGLVERHGDAALVSYERGTNSEPASVLLVKGEAGWRIRNYLAG